MTRAYRLLEKGQLDMLEPEPSAGLLEAVDAVALAVLAVDEYERKRGHG